MVEEQELRRRLTADAWMLRDVDTAFESIHRRGAQTHRVCKVCEESVALWQREKHLRCHQRARETMLRKSAAKTEATRLRNLELAREARRR